MPHMHSRCNLLAALLLVLLVPLPAAELQTVTDDDPTPVGEWARPSQWLITGNRAVPEARLRAALLDHAPILAAVHARAPRGELVRQVHEGLHTAYRAYGHITASVRVGSRDGRLAIVIDEGAPCTAGAVEVAGMTIAPPAELVAALADARAAHGSLQAWTQRDIPQLFIAPVMPSPAEDTALWTLGGRPDASERNLRRIADAVAAFYERHGRMAVRCAVAVQEDAGRARLRISIVDEGRPAVLARIAWRELRPALIPRVEADFGLRAGMPCDLATLRTCFERLHASGRFFAPLIRIEESADGYVLTVTTRELASLPPYPEPLRPEAETLLRTHRWLIDNFIHGDQEILFRHARDGGEFDLALSRTAAAMRIAFRGRDLLHAWSDGGRWVVIDPANGRRYETPEMQTFMVFDLHSQPAANPDQGEQSMGLQVGATTGRRHGDLLRVERCDPSAFVSLAYRLDEQQRVVARDLPIRDGTVLAGKSDAFPGIVLDLATGRPLPSPQLSFATGAVARLRVELARTAPVAAAATPLDLGSFAEFWLDLMHGCLDQPDAQAADVFARLRLLIRHVIAPGGQWLVAAMDAPASGPGDDFTIPRTAAVPRSPSGMLGELADRFLAPPALALQERLPVGSWPPVILRGAQAVLTGRMPLANQDLEATAARPDFGPVGALCIAAILDRFSPREAAQFAALGMRLIDDEARFRAEVALFRPFAADLMAWAAAPGRTDLLGVLGDRRPAVEAALRAALTEAQRSGADAAATVEAAALAMWRAGVRAWVGDLLFDIMSGRMPDLGLPRLM